MRQSRRTVTKGKRSRTANTSRMNLVILALLFAIVISMICGQKFVAAHEDGYSLTEYRKYYKSITLEEGDSLWSIAKEYCNEDLQSIDSYIEEIRELNQLKSDTIHEGHGLTIAYYGIPKKK